MNYKRNEINPNTDTELAHVDVTINYLAFPSVHRVFIVQREGGSLYTIWNLISSGTAITNYNEQKYLEVYNELEKKVKSLDNPLISHLTANELRNLDLIFILDLDQTRVFNSLNEMNEPTVSKLMVTYKDF